MTNIDFNKIICKRILSLRKMRGFTMEKLAYQSGISKGGLSEIERGMKEPRLYTIAKICATLNISINEFFDFPELKNFLEKYENEIEQ